eukprot:g24358.t1
MSEVRRAILISPKVALWKRPFVTEDLLDQVLSSDLMCIPDEVLFDLFLAWEEGEGCLSRRELIEKYVCLQRVPSEKIKAFVLNPEFNILKTRKPNKIPDTLHIVDLAGHLGLQPVYSLGAGLGEWMEWKLPSHFALKLLGFRFADGIALENVDFSLCSRVAMVQDETKKDWVADRLAASFGRSFGRFTVVVEDRSDRWHSEFKVSAEILCAWSEVIRDFSPQGVEAFLRFLYSGTLNAELETLAEVAIIADKYQVLDLAMHCLDLLKKELNAETAWEILKAAEQFELGDLREAAMHTILISPKVALWKRPFVSEDLLDQVLSSDLMCIPDEVLFDLFLGWEEGEGCLSRRELIEKYVCLQSVPSEKIKAFVLNPKFNILKARKPRKIPVTEHTVDLEGRLALQPYCSSSTGTGEWMEWKLPSHFALKLLGFRVTDQLENLDFCLWLAVKNGRMA